MNLFEELARQHRQNASAICLHQATADGLHAISWAEVEALSGRMANWLTSLNLPTQSRLLVQTEKSAAALCFYLASLRSGMIYVPLNTAYQQAELAYFISDAEPALIVARPQDLAALRDYASCPHIYALDENYQGEDSVLSLAQQQSAEFTSLDLQPQQLAAILYTSGTTGRSKGAMLSHQNLLSNARTLHQQWQWHSSDVLLHSLPIFHVHGLFVASHGALLAGASMIFLEKFELTQVLRYLPLSTVFMGVPTYYVRLLSSPEFDAGLCQHMRLFISGSAPLLLDTFNEFQGRTGHRILERYGMSETTMLCSNPYEGERKPGSVGPALPGLSLRITNAQGEICAVDEIGAIEVKGENVFSGYWRMPEKTAAEFTQDAYFITGDLGYRDADNYVFIVGRSKDLIISGGYNVYPKEVESYLDDLPGVAESAVVGIPHPDFGEAVCAFVVARADAELDVAQLYASLKQKIANFKVPKQIYLVSELPRNTMGKVQKNRLREQLCQSPE